MLRVSPVRPFATLPLNARTSLHVFMSAHARTRHSALATSPRRNQISASSTGMALLEAVPRSLRPASTRSSWLYRAPPPQPREKELCVRARTANRSLVPSVTPLTTAPPS